VVKKVLLHICCGVCAFHAIEKLKEKGFYVEGFFFNPNIYPESEYLKRKEATEKVGELASIKIRERKYEPKIWFDVCGSYKDEKEGLNRCLLCYRLRMKETLNTVQVLGFDYFSTTLTISPHKNSKAIIELGREMGKDKFLAIDFKKSNGFKKTMDLAKRHNLYRQNYCGCVYSIRNEK
jgi:predicted adenine nucleotide alpha hydrolase (AANH) superfamily ATPase